MKKLARIYTDTVREHMVTYFGNWEPGTNLKIGDYGLLDDNIFRYLGNISQLGLDFTLREDDHNSHAFFQSNEGVEFALNAKVAVAIPGGIAANANLDIKFTKENAVFFNAAECKTTMIENKTELGNAILKLHKENKWKKEFVVITDIVNAARTTIAVSLSNDSNVVFEATSPEIAQLDLADASIEMKIKTGRSGVYFVEAETGLVPLIGLCKIQRGGWFNPENVFEPMSNKIAFPMLNSLEMEESLTEKDLHFNQVK